MPVVEDSLTPAPIAHLHFVFFGVDLSLPLSQPRGSDQRGGESDIHTASFVRLSGEQPATAKAGIGSVLTALPVLYDLPQDIRSPESKPSVLPVPVTAVSLCDSARLERSGVRLI